jgi:all-trans-nonaprenyl-diphosphate synthase
MANSAKAAGLLSEVSPEIAENLYNYGRHLGLAFQIVDDILDFTSSTDTLGKPVGSDLKNGNLTAPVLFALAEQPHLETLIEREFTQDSDLEQALELIENSQGVPQAKELAAYHAKLAAENISTLAISDARQTLINLTDFVLSRLY